MNVSIYFNTQRTKKDGTIPISIYVSRRNQRFYISTGLTCKQIFDGSIFPRTEPNHKAKTARLNKIMDGIEELIINNPTMSNENIKTLIKEHVFCETPKRRVLLDYFNEYTETKTKDATQKNYRSTYSRIKAFDPNVTLETLDNLWLERFERHLHSFVKPNSAHTHITRLRAVVNWAIKNQWTTNYPFRWFKAQTEPTRKKNLPIETLRDIRDLKDLTEIRAVYRDVFMLMFYLIGINGKDLLLAKNSQIIDGRLEYYRYKTKEKRKQLLSVRIEPEAWEIINKYRGEENILYFCESRSVPSFMICLDRALKFFYPDLSTNYARHSWATIARKLKVPKEDISLAMGHSYGSNITSIYIEEDYSVVDVANRKVLDYLKGDAE